MTAHVVNGEHADEQRGRYRAVSRPAVVSLLCGVLSILTVFDWALAVIPATGIILGWLALRQIRDFPQYLTGRGVAFSGLILSAVFWVFGYGWLMLERVSEVPRGHERVDYDMLQPGPGERVPSEVFKYQGEKVFIKGYMQAGRQQTRLKVFILCPSIPGCPFCTPDPTPTEMILVQLEGDLEVDFTTHQVGLGGRLRVDPESPDGLPYHMDVSYFRSPP